MWAQIIKTRVKPGREGQVKQLLEQLRSIEQPDSGLVRSTAMLDQNDPTMLYLMVVFENEDQARARERDPRRTEGLQRVRAIMEEVVDGEREFIDLNVLEETVR
jgi:antibiotic biosynthesis monooxygenase (ABM) superfamily enzyme